MIMKVLIYHCPCRVDTMPQGSEYVSVLADDVVIWRFHMVFSYGVF